MGIVQAIKNLAPAVPDAVKPDENFARYANRGYVSIKSTSGKRVTVEGAKGIASAYRCANTLSDDIASMPLQQFYKIGDTIQRVLPDHELRNTSYLYEVEPNRWMNPSVFKKTLVDWLTWYGNAYTWTPVDSYRETFILDADETFPWFDAKGNKWYKTKLPNGKELLLPDVEVMHLMINPVNGLYGRGVIEYARDTIGRQMSAHETQDKISGKGLVPAAAITMAGELKGTEGDEARKRVKAAYIDAISGSENAGGVAVFDNRVQKFEAVTMKPVDAQFLETMQFTDMEIANFFKMPLWKINQGKQSYESNTQQQIDYLQTTLNPILVQFEQAMRIKMLAKEEQPNNYFRFNRASLLQTDPKSQAEYMEKMAQNGFMSPNEGREIIDISPYEGGDGHYFAANMAKIGEDGSLISASNGAK